MHLPVCITCRVLLGNLWFQPLASTNGKTKQVIEHRANFYLNRVKYRGKITEIWISKYCLSHIWKEKAKALQLRCRQDVRSPDTQPPKFKNHMSAEWVQTLTMTLETAHPMTAIPFVVLSPSQAQQSNYVTCSSIHLPCSRPEWFSSLHPLHPWMSVLLCLVRSLIILWVGAQRSSSYAFPKVLVTFSDLSFSISPSAIGIPQELQGFFFFFTPSLDFLHSHSFGDNLFAGGPHMYTSSLVVTTYFIAFLTSPFRISQRHLKINMT